VIITHSDDKFLVVTKPSIFLAGPTPRATNVESWRPRAIDLLHSMKFDGQVIVPERRSWELGFYGYQVEWEFVGLENCTKIVFWIPRDLETMPAFTTNVEFGRYVDSGRIIYGRPIDAPKTRYLDWLYTKMTGKLPIRDLYTLLDIAVREIKSG